MQHCVCFFWVYCGYSWRQFVTSCRCLANSTTTMVTTPSGTQTRPTFNTPFLNSRLNLLFKGETHLRFENRWENAAKFTRHQLYRGLPLGETFMDLEHRPQQKVSFFTNYTPRNQQFAPENRPPKPQRKVIFQPSIFRCKMLVSGSAIGGQCWVGVGKESNYERDSDLGMYLKHF